MELHPKTFYFAMDTKSVAWLVSWLAVQALAGDIDGSQLSALFSRSLCDDVVRAKYRAVHPRDFFAIDDSKSEALRYSQRSRNLRVLHRA